VYPTMISMKKPDQDCGCHGYATEIRETNTDHFERGGETDFIVE
jgi:hypothetical protein